MQQSAENYRWIFISSRKYFSSLYLITPMLDLKTINSHQILIRLCLGYKVQTKGKNFTLEICCVKNWKNYFFFLPWRSPDAKGRLSLHKKSEMSKTMRNFHEFHQVLHRGLWRRKIVVDVNSMNQTRMKARMKKFFKKVIMIMQKGFNFLLPSFHIMSSFCLSNDLMVCIILLPTFLHSLCLCLFATTTMPSLIVP